MKRIILLLWALILFLAVSCFSQDYVITKEGKTPIMITASHGGDVRLPSEERDCRGCSYKADLHTDVIADMLASRLNAYLVLNQIHRSSLDANRSTRTAYTGPIGRNNYDAYHSFISTTANLYSTTDDIFLILDVHGNAHSHGKIELGYDIPRSILNDNERLYEYRGSVFENIDKPLDQLIFGYRSLGTLFEIFQYPTYPSSLNSYVPEEYFNGGYTTETYKEYPGVLVIQLELPYKGIRDSEENIERFVNIASRVINFYYTQINN